jgi:NAD(P)-dependent dehydrogenase (short-subunit alcohol dehydrogenase family)
MMNLDLTDKRCIVVGGGRGLGAEIARQLALEGADVVVTARTRADVEAVADEVRQLGRRAGAVVGDLADTADAARMMAEAVAVFGGVDVLVNSATGSAPGGFAALTDEQWEAGLAIKPLGFARAARGVLPAMRENGRGRIVNICGSGGRYVTWDYALGAANAATLHLTKHLAETEAKHGVSAIAVNPGPIHTARLEQFVAARAEAANRPFGEYWADHVKSLPLGRIPSPSEIARVVVFFCSDLSEYCSGSAVQIDGASLPGIF